MNKILALAISIIFFSGCSSKQMYQFGQDVQRSDCARNVISLEQYDHCMQSNQVPFEDYQKEREAVIKEMEDNKD